MEFNKARDYLETAIRVTEKKLSIAKAEFDEENYVDSYQSVKEIADYLGALDELHNQMTQMDKATVLKTLEEWDKKNNSILK